MYLFSAKLQFVNCQMKVKPMHIPSSASECTSSTACTSAVDAHTPDHRRANELRTNHVSSNKIFFKIDITSGRDIE